MKNLTLCVRNGIQLAVTKRGEVFITLNGYIKLSGKPKQTVSERTTRAYLLGKVVEAPLTVPGRGLRQCKLISAALALEWLAKDNPKLAEAIDGNLFGFLQQPVDLSQYHKKPVAVDVVTEIVPVAENSNLQRFDRNGIELIIDRVTGEAWATVRGYARMSGRDASTVSRRTKGDAPEAIKQAQIQTEGGLQGVALIPANICFKWAIKDNPALAEAMGTAGATIYMHQLAGFKATSDAIAQPEPTPSPQPPQLTSAERVKLAVATDAIFAKYGMAENPRFKQLAQDFMGDLLGFNQNALPASDTEKWCGVAERAEQLGYPVALVVKHRSQLGRWVATRVNGWIKEDRLCNGTQRPINLYRVTPQLDGAIAAYFAQI